MSEGYEALRHGAAWLDLSARGRFLVRGRDRARLLHNVTSNEIKKLAPGSGCYAFMLTPQGRIQADLNLFCFDDRFLIDTEPELREKVPQFILKFKVADQGAKRTAAERAVLFFIDFLEGCALIEFHCLVEILEQIRLADVHQLNLKAAGGFGLRHEILQAAP